MKKLLVLAAAAVMMMSLFTGCKEEFKCDACKEDVVSVKHEVEIMGKTMEICDDCNDEWEEAKEELEGMLG